MLTLPSEDRALHLTAAVFVAGLIIHNGDHARRGLTGTPEAVIWGGTAILTLAAVALTLVAVRHPAAPVLAAVAGLGTSAGVTASHLLPDWGPLSDPLPGAGVGVATWVAVLAEIAAALAFGAAGLISVRRRHRAGAGA